MTIWTRRGGIGLLLRGGGELRISRLRRIVRGVTIAASALPQRTHESHSEAAAAAEESLFRGR